MVIFSASLFRSEQMYRSPALFSINHIDPLSCCTKKQLWMCSPQESGCKQFCGLLRCSDQDQRALSLTPAGGVEGREKSDLRLKHKNS